MTVHTPTVVRDLELESWRQEVVERFTAGARLAGLYCTHRPGGAELHALLATDTGIECLRAPLLADRDGGMFYDSLTPAVPAAFWYERALHDLSGVVPIGHPRLDPLLLPLSPGQRHPRPGHPGRQAHHPSAHEDATEQQGPADVSGHGVFTLPLGPVRSGVFESIEFLIETPGEQIPHLNIRPHYKHRGIARRFDGVSLADGVLVAERVEGIASVAHALAFAHAAESLADAVPPSRARLIRVLHAELERIANHLEVVLRLADAAGLAVATARFSWHKEEVMRLVSALCGNRFGRSVVIAGGVRAEPAIGADAAATRIGVITKRIHADRRALMGSASFLDRLRGTGPLDPALAASHGALGPIGRASGVTEDVRLQRGYDAYPELTNFPAAVSPVGDVLARLQVRWTEIDTSVALIAEACQRLTQLAAGPCSVAVQPGNGFASGWAEAPQGEVLYGLELREGRVGRCFARSASLHNMVLFHDVFHGDVFTDFAFIEASFGLSYAGVAM